MKNLISLMVLLSSLTTFAGHRGGNGGDAVVCGDKVYMLDEVEAPRNGYTYALNPNLEYAEQVREGLQNLSDFLPELKNEISQHTEELISDIDTYLESNGTKLVHKNISFVKEELSNIDDSNHPFLDANCKLQQIVYQRVKPIGLERRYLIDLNLFNKLDNKSKASLVLHEAIYRYYIRKFYAAIRFDSSPVRNLNNLITSKELKNLEIGELLNTLKSLGITYITIKNGKFYLQNSGKAKLVLSAGDKFRLNSVGKIVGNILFEGQNVGDDSFEYSNTRLVTLDFNQRPVTINEIEISQSDKICQASTKKCLSLHNFGFREKDIYTLDEGKYEFTEQTVLKSSWKLDHLVNFLSTFKYEKNSCEVTKTESRTFLDKVFFPKDQQPLKTIVNLRISKLGSKSIKKKMSYNKFYGFTNKDFKKLRKQIVKMCLE